MGDKYHSDDDLVNHAAELDAHTYNWGQKLRTGEYMLPLPVAYASMAYTIGYSAGVAIPFLVSRDLTIDRLAVETTVADAGKTGRLGIYNDGVDLYPGTLVLDYGTIDIGVVGILTASADQALTKGLYWLVYTSDGNATLRWLMPAWFPLGQLATAFDHTRRQIGWNKAAMGAGALADPFPGGGTIYSYARQVAILPRLKTLD